MFEREFMAGWGDMDFNSHMRNTAFLDKSADVRMMFFADHGFSMEEFLRRKFGPVIRRDDLEYFKEVRLLERFKVSLINAGLSDDGSRFLLRNEFRKEGGALIATVTSAGGWLDLETRRLMAPPPALLEALRSLTPSESFQLLPSSIKHDG